MLYSKDIFNNCLKTSEDKAITESNKNYCTVKALAIAKDLPLSEAHKLLKPYRKSDKKGIKENDWQYFLLNNGFRKVFDKGFLTFSKLEDLGYLKRDRVYILIKRGHTFTLKYGKLYERIGGRTKILAAFEAHFPLMVI